jgi:hypothetical protein
MLGGGQARTEIHGRGGLANAAFLVGNRNYLGQIPLLPEENKSVN